MYRSIRSSTQLTRATLAAASSSSASASASVLSRAAAARRLASTAAAPTRRSWKGAAARWGLAGAALYWYNTSPIFADDAVKSPLQAAADAATHTDPSASGASSPVPVENFLTVDALLEEKQKDAARRRADEQKSREDSPPSPAPADGSPEALEAEAGQQGAFNPETGEINWDCPCLGGMAHGPCGEDFKAAFSCFVFSAEEPKGMDCIDKFQHMQDCFRQYPEIYGSELQDDDEADAAAGPGDVTDEKPANGAPTKAQIADKLAETKTESEPEPQPETEPKTQTKSGAPTSTPAADTQDDVVQADVTETEEKPKTEKKKAKAKKAKKTSKTDKADKTESIPTAATDATGAADAEPPADERSLPKAAFDATSANQ